MMSGGNTQIVHVKDYTKFEVLGRTRDDAIGEAFDKVARVVGLGYPGGPKVDKLAKEGKANIELPKTHFDEDTLDFSFSGIKTAVINLNHKNPNINKADLCASFQKNVTDTLIENVKKAVDKTKIKRIVLAGGVSANSYIRENNEKTSIKSIPAPRGFPWDTFPFIAKARPWSRGSIPWQDFIMRQVVRNAAIRLMNVIMFMYCKSMSLNIMTAS